MASVQRISRTLFSSFKFSVPFADCTASTPPRSALKGAVERCRKAILYESQTSAKEKKEMVYAGEKIKSCSNGGDTSNEVDETIMHMSNVELSTISVFIPTLDEYELPDFPFELVENRAMEIKCNLCDHCKTERSAEIKLKQCARCKRNWYGSSLCQKSAWNAGGHKTFCRKPSEYKPGDIIRLRDLKKKVELNGAVVEVVGVIDQQTDAGETRWKVDYIGGGNPLSVRESCMVLVIGVEERESLGIP
ncbi:hypothetical protein HDU76_006896 [Blyttiomyces sp. JEL0837]|nr:hypothetical protein HDU76_006896 [Blyttiomyces sp. JEL0837]